ncbi:transposase-like zinc-binding domain-containing protein [Cardinium endosymbiont of Culicoides punctatus]|nr:hypothetical protein CCPUN_08360 [Cardinium endosymbiont of Culicoides punctatus]
MEKWSQFLTEVNVVKNGFNKDQKQSYLCKSCKKQCIERNTFNV